MFPIPPGTHSREVQAIQLEGGSPLPPRALPATRECRSPRQSKPVFKRAPLCGGLSFAEPVPAASAIKKPVEKPTKARRTKVKVDPKLKEAAREFRDRYLEQVNEGGYLLASAGKYDLTRQLAVDGPAELLKLAA